MNQDLNTTTRAALPVWDHLEEDFQRAMRIVSHIDRSVGSSDIKIATMNLNMCYGSLIVVGGGVVAKRIDNPQRHSKVQCRTCGQNPLAPEHTAPCSAEFALVSVIPAAEFEPIGRPDGLYGCKISPIPDAVDMRRTLETLASLE